MSKLIKNRPVFDVSPGVQVFISLVVVFVSFVGIMLAGLVLAMALFQSDMTSLATGSEFIYSSENLGLIKYLQIVQSIALFVVPPFIIALLLSKSVSRYLNIDFSPNKHLVIYTILAMLAAIPVINFFAEINSWLSLPEWLSGVEEWMREKEDQAMELTKLFLAADNLQALLLNIFMIGFLPAVGEELLFRGILQKQFTLWFKSHHLGILISAILFSALHLQFYGFLPRTMLGVLFGYMLVWSGSLWIPIIGHFVNNTTIVIISYFTELNVIDPGIEEVGSTKTGIGYFFLAALVFIPVLWMFYKRSSQVNPRKLS
ncbi:MAG: CPBP family intramembrane glutamic endopeptidase [Bacteroidota bacterium]